MSTVELTKFAQKAARVVPTLFMGLSDAGMNYRLGSGPKVITREQTE